MNVETEINDTKRSRKHMMGDQRQTDRQWLGRQVQVEAEARNKHVKGKRETLKAPQINDDAN